MAKNRRWSRYQAPAEMRDETGQPVAEKKPAPSKPKPKPKPTSPPKASRSQSRPKSKPTPKSTASSKTWVGPVVTVVLIVGAIAVAAALANSDDDGDLDPVDTTILTEEFVADSLAGASKELGEQVVSVNLSEYNMTVEFFDPNAEETRYFETTKYSDGFTVRVEENHYDGYLPRPFDLTVLSADRMIAAVEEAIAAADDPYTFDLRITADRDSGQVSMVATADGEDQEPVEITSKP